MFFLTACVTDQGPVRSSNQDAYTVKVFQSGERQAALAVMCDGMGGLSQGEVASARMIRALDDWSHRKLPALLEEGLPSGELAAQWSDLIHRENRGIWEYGQTQGVRLGTTVTALLTAERQCYLLHVGDCRAYRITDDGVFQLTQDETLAAQELRAGRITEEEYLQDSRKNILLQCVGAGGTVVPSLLAESRESECVFLLCSDGFYHTLTVAELAALAALRTDRDGMRAYLEELGLRCRQRGEQDNLTALAISCCESSCRPTVPMEGNVQGTLQILEDSMVIHALLSGSKEC